MLIAKVRALRSPPATLARTSRDSRDLGWSWLTLLRVSCGLPARYFVNKALPLDQLLLRPEITAVGPAETAVSEAETPPTDATEPTFCEEMLRMLLTFVLFVALHQAWLYVSDDSKPVPFSTSNLPPDAMDALRQAAAGNADRLQHAPPGRYSDF